MAVRRIPKNHIFVTGGYSSRKNEGMDGFESLLEKDFLILLDFDEEVESFEVQPVRVPVPNVPPGYVPDVLVRYTEASGRRPMLAEVKSSGDLAHNAAKYQPKFEAAHKYAKEQGWEFRVLDETFIRTPRLANLKFLREFRNVDVSEFELQTILDAAHALRSALSVNRLASMIAADSGGRLHWQPRIWAAILQGHLLLDIDVPFTEDVPLQVGVDPL